MNPVVAVCVLVAFLAFVSAICWTLHVLDSIGAHRTQLQLARAMVAELAPQLEEAERCLFEAMDEHDAFVAEVAILFGCFKKHDHRECISAARQRLAPVRFAG